jgi:hypothetical protein
MDYNEVEDSVMKKAMEFFQENAVDFFELDKRIAGPAATAKAALNFNITTFFKKPQTRNINR